MIGMEQDTIVSVDRRMTKDEKGLIRSQITDLKGNFVLSVGSNSLLHWLFYFAL